MPTKTTKKTSTKKDSTKKVVVKRRKLDLTPTRASAVAIASQSNREKKKALIEKLSSESNVVKKTDKSTKIPLWVRIFFGCSLMLFCISFYKAIICPQLETELEDTHNDTNIYRTNWENSNQVEWEGRASIWDTLTNDIESQEIVQIENPQTPQEVIQLYFSRLSNYQFDEAYSLFTPALQRSSEIRNHFTSFRMNPFISWIEWWLHPTNIQYVNTTTYWKDRYSFDLSYTLSSNGERYDETWEFVVDTSWEEKKIASILCTTTKCSRHPIFWPENFGLMR